MPTPPTTPTYVRIKARSTSIVGVFKIYRGEDHLLMAEANGFNERYRRFYYRDVMALYYRPSKKFLWMTLGLGIPAALLALLTVFAYSSDAVAGTIFLIPTALLLIAFIINLVKGKSCQFFVKTAVKEHELPPVSRIRAATHLISEIAPLIAAAQQSIPSPDPIATTVSGQVETPRTSPISSEPSIPDPRPPTDPPGT